MAMAAAASSSAAPPEKYDVFLSFRGEDARDTFTSHLHAALEGKKIETYIDYRLEKGDKIGPALLDAIEKSKIAVVILSKDYATSTWCLDELAHILVRKKEHGQIVIPIFYRIEPSHVRKQEGSFADAFGKHTQRFEGNMEKVRKWRADLEEAANLSGFHDSSKAGTGADFVKEVVEDILTKLKRGSSSNLKGLVAIESRIEKTKSLLCINDSSIDVCTVGIWGMGGIGKTTLAEAVFHDLSSKFEASCLLEHVREKSEQHGLHHLEKTLLRGILKEEDSSIGHTLNRERLSRTKVLIVFYDVSDSNQIERLAADYIQYGPGSRIIITTRDRRTLLKFVKDDKIYQVEGLNWDDALQLFHSHAFKNDSIGTGYSELSKMVVDYAGGLPLALKILGSLFFRCESIEEWQEQFNKLKKYPSKEIHSAFRLSYDRLGENEQEIFLDIACFHKGKKMDDVKRMLEIHGFFPKTGIKFLLDMSLISISRWGFIHMHDLLQEMGQAIAGEKEPRKRRRLFMTKDVYHVLKSKKETAKIQAIFFNWSEIEELHLNRANFKKMDNLRLLGVSTSKYGYCKLNVSLNLPKSLFYLQWNRYPFKSLPSDFSPVNLVELHMPYNQLEQLWNEGQDLMNLKVIDLSFSKHLTELPYLSRSLKIEHIDLSCCKSLVEIPSYFQNLDKLTHLNLKLCTSLESLPEMPANIEFLSLHGAGITELPSSVWSHENISFLDIRDCKYLEKLPSNCCKLKVSGTFNLKWCSSLAKFWELPRNISVLDLSYTVVKEIHSSIEFLRGLKKIQLKNCSCLVSLPTSICKLKSLEEINLTGCSKFECFPEILEPMEHLEFLYLEGTSVKELPSSMEFLSGLKRIELKDCRRLMSFPASICKLKSLDLRGCFAFEYFPKILKPTEHLVFLCLEGTSVKELHSSMEFLSGLKRIELKDCRRLVRLPASICKLKSLERLDLKGCYVFEYFPEILEPMEHLEFLSLSSTAVKELPLSIRNLIGLQKLDLSYCRELEVVPDSLLCLPSLRELDLSESMIKSIPASIKQASQLSRLCLNGCERLRCLPELPVLRCLEANDCKSLETLSSSRTTLTQSWEKYQLFPGQLTFSNCVKLDHNAVSNINDDVHLRIMRVATAPSKFEEEEDKVDDTLVSVVYPGDEIPKWFKHQNEGSSITIKLPPDWFGADFLGFAVSLLVACECLMDWWWDLRCFECKCNTKTSNSESHEINYPSYAPRRLEREGCNVVVWYGAFPLVEGPNLEYSTAFNRLGTQASFDFHVRHRPILLSRPRCRVKVKKCGIRLLYGQDAEIIKLEGTTAT